MISIYTLSTSDSFLLFVLHDVLFSDHYVFLMNYVMSWLLGELFTWYYFSTCCTSILAASICLTFSFTISIFIKAFVLLIKVEDTRARNH